MNWSAGIGERIGTSIIAGDVSDNSDRPEAFWKLRKARVGQVVRVRDADADADGTAQKHRISSRSEHLRSQRLPRRLFNTAGQHRLALVTRTDKVTYPGGGFHYTTNLVVIAKPVR